LTMSADCQPETGSHQRGRNLYVKSAGTPGTPGRKGHHDLCSDDLEETPPAERSG